MEFAKVQSVTLKDYARTIAVSDLHGNPAGFHGVLEQVGFSAQDALVIVGDVLEKGPDSLGLLHEVMSMCKTGGVFLVEGNNDALFREWIQYDIPAADVLWYLNHQTTTIAEMARALALPYRTEQDIAALKEAIRVNFPEELAFLSSLPTILDTDLGTFVHAGLQDGPLDRQEKEFCISAPNFLSSNTRIFEKTLVVGHWPVSCFSKKGISFSSIYDEAYNIWSIDGGSGTKKYGQINYLIFAHGNITSGCWDGLPKIRALDHQRESEDALTLCFPDTRLEVLSTDGQTCICRFPAVNRTMNIAKDTIYEYKRNTYCADLTTYCPEVRPGDVLSLCEMKDGRALVKKDGIMGYYDGLFAVL